MTQLSYKERLKELQRKNRIRNRNILKDRIAGMQYAPLAAKYGLHPETVRSICKEAVRKGKATYQQIRHHPRATEPWPWCLGEEIAMGYFHDMNKND